MGHPYLNQSLPLIKLSLSYYPPFSADGSCGIDQDSVLEELLGKVKSNKVASKQSAHPFKRPDVAMSQNIPFNEISTKNNQIQNPFRKSTGIKRSLKEVVYVKIT